MYSEAVKICWYAHSGVYVCACAIYTRAYLFVVLFLLAQNQRAHSHKRRIRACCTEFGSGSNSQQSRIYYEKYNTELFLQFIYLLPDPLSLILLRDGERKIIFKLMNALVAFYFYIRLLFLYASPSLLLSSSLCPTYRDVSIMRGNRKIMYPDSLPST